MLKDMEAGASVEISVGEDFVDSYLAATAAAVGG